jgi:hypothetical protein
VLGLSFVLQRGRGMTAAAGVPQLGPVALEGGGHRRPARGLRLRTARKLGNGAVDRAMKFGLRRKRARHGEAGELGPAPAREGGVLAEEATRRTSSGVG